MSATWAIGSLVMGEGGWQGSIGAGAEVSVQESIALVVSFYKCNWHQDSEMEPLSYIQVRGM